MCFAERTMSPTAHQVRERLASGDSAIVVWSILRRRLKVHEVAENQVLRVGQIWSSVLQEQSWSSERSKLRRLACAIKEEQTHLGEMYDKGWARFRT